MLGLGLFIVIGGFAFAQIFRYRDVRDTPLEQPIFIQQDEVGTFTPDQQEKIANFKKKVLARAVSSVPLTEQEKSVISMSIGISPMLPLPGGTTVANQDVYRFSDEELRTIAEAIRR